MLVEFVNSRVFTVVAAARGNFASEIGRIVGPLSTTPVKSHPNSTICVVCTSQSGAKTVAFPNKRYASPLSLRPSSSPTASGAPTTISSIPSPLIYLDFDAHVPRRFPGWPTIEKSPLPSPAPLPKMPERKRFSSICAGDDPLAPVQTYARRTPAPERNSLSTFLHSNHSCYPIDRKLL